ncbi:MAG: RNA polymerase sigma factor [Eggerthellaceae bacterium]|nr:RNA polymerase sigma factor [Eggerthellaceae bacterium]
MVDAGSQDTAWFVALYERHADTVFGVCRTHLRNAADAEDATQSVFLKLLANPRSFESAEHEKAWLIRVAINHCKDVLKARWNQHVGLEEAPEPAAMDRDPFGAETDTLEQVMSLPENQRICVYLYYYEGYNAAQIASLLGKPSSTVRNYLSEARRELKKRLGGEFDERADG